MVEITRAEILQASKIIVVTYHSGIKKGYLFTPENMESILLDFDNIEKVYILDMEE